ADVTSRGGLGDLTALPAGDHTVGAKAVGDVPDVTHERTVVRPGLVIVDEVVDGASVVQGVVRYAAVDLPDLDRLARIRVGAGAEVDGELDRLPVLDVAGEIHRPELDRVRAGVVDGEWFVVDGELLVAGHPVVRLRGAGGGVVRIQGDRHVAGEDVTRLVAGQGRLGRGRRLIDQELDLEDPGLNRRPSTGRGHLERRDHSGPRRRVIRVRSIRMRRAVHVERALVSRLEVERIILPVGPDRAGRELHAVLIRDHHVVRERRNVLELDHITLLDAELGLAETEPVDPDEDLLLGRLPPVTRQ